jgi:hypothetical protein
VSQTTQRNHYEWRNIAAALIDPATVYTSGETERPLRQLFKGVHVYSSRATTVEAHKAYSFDWVGPPSHPCGEAVARVSCDSGSGSTRAVFRILFLQ